MVKTLTDKLITDKLEAKGYLEYHDMDETKAWNLLEKHYDCEVSDQWSNKSFDFYCYEETTSDGYTVYIATHNPDSVCVSEDIHYYENDLADEIAEAIQEGQSMYVDDLDWHPFMEAVEESYGSMVNDIKEEIENKLIEQGYEYENRDEAATEMV
jgi:hypothetical protein